MELDNTYKCRIHEFLQSNSFTLLLLWNFLPSWNPVLTKTIHDFNFMIFFTFDTGVFPQDLIIRT